MRKTVAFSGLVVLLFAADAAAQTVHYVDIDATGADTGTSWANAFTDLQDGLAAGDSGDEIWVAEGTYLPTPGTDRSISFQLVGGVEVFGGFDGTEGQLHERNWAEHKTILSGDIGTPGSAGDNSYHVVFASGVDRTSLLDGFVVEQGNANGNSEPLGDAGGGLFIQSGGPTIQNVIVRDNSAPNGAGVMARDGSDPQFVNGLFYGNLSGGDGGAIAAVGNSPVDLLSVTMADNVATVGGALYVSGSTVVLRNAILWDNQGGEIATEAGGAVDASFAIIEGGYSGTSILDDDPLFIDSPSHNYRLRVDSPGVSYGDLASVPFDTFDLDGDGDTLEALPYDLGASARIQGPSPDIGAYEYSTPSCPSGSVFFIRKGASGAGSGTSWEDAMPEMRSAMDHLAGCSFVGQVWVTEGTYLTSLNENEDETFELRNGLALLGGFVGTETESSQRDWEAHPTILSGAIGTSSTSDNALHTVATYNTDESAVLDGFVVTEAREGGVFVQDGSPSLAHLIVRDNEYGEPDPLSGGGMRIHGGSPTLTEVLFEDNRGDIGAGMYAMSAAPTLIRTSFINNNALSSGGGMFLDESDAILIDATFVGNTAQASGGAVYIRNSSPEFTNTVFSTNLAGGPTPGFGGAVYVESGGPSFIESVFEDNTANFFGHGGAVYVEAGSPQWRGARFTDNLAHSHGGAVALGGGNSLFYRVEFERNIAQAMFSSSGGAVYMDNATALIINASFRGNTATYVDDTIPMGARGGALRADDATNLTLVNPLFVGNKVVASDHGLSSASGGAMSLRGITLVINPTLIQNTISSIGTLLGSSIYASSGSTTLNNLITWENVGAPDIENNPDATVIVTNGIVQGGYPDGTNILDTDPLFNRNPNPGPDNEWGTEDDDYGDLRPVETSRAIDFGDSALLPPDDLDLDSDGDTTEPIPYDLDSSARIEGPSVDLGAYECCVTVDTEPGKDFPSGFTLLGAYPNPFNPSTRIAFDLPRDSEVTLEVFDVLGRTVTKAAPQPLAAGTNRSIELDGSRLASGLYLYRITAEFGGEIRRATGRVTLLK